MTLSFKNIHVFESQNTEREKKKRKEKKEEEKKMEEEEDNFHPLVLSSYGHNR